MKMAVYCVFDSVSEEAGPLMAYKSDPIAYRSYLRMISAEGINASDYVLYCIGTYDVDSMEIEGIKPRRVIASNTVEV